jgi:hypothetical protein
MSELDLNWKFEKNKIRGTYDDKPVKGFMISGATDILGFEVEENPDSDGKGIDCRAKHDHSIGIEIERGEWIGNFWEDLYYSWLSKLEFQTVNMPKRKEKYYLPSYTVGYGENKKTIDNRDKMNKVIFVRWNWDGSQAIVVYPETVHDSTKLQRSKFPPKNNEEKKEEKFLSFKKEDSVTMNKQIDGKFVRDTEPNGKYVQLSKEEIEKQTNEIKEHRAKIRAEKDQEKKKRAASVYKEFMNKTK